MQDHEEHEDGPIDQYGSKEEAIDEYFQSQLNPEQNPLSVGYISIKDFAYDVTNPLHYGYFEDAEERADNELYNEDEHDDDDDDDNDDTKRQSIILPTNYIVNQRAVALYDFVPENDSELGLEEGDIVFISYKHGQGWLVAENQGRTKTGLVPEEFVSFLEDDEDYEDEDEDKARPFYLTQFITQSINSTSTNTSYNEVDGGEDDEWEDVDQLESDLHESLKITDQ
ncbi:hypothetical protein Kpol_2000p2 [Vanderwaltozyma polyspora DSM 70294]|uniref:SH3 domain-containing protein n=1 Tax=Vanderwaltozyma polyspora (strain ATCC 22028 / DSM 70294 / BCRC 21397 / CBS 2163 / NBRC 10782 / NRRL Y-8283 / UCD 57-17) TaxID=436907 RepID=A7TF13_VANPO|nr:uncharacterized protein Kpol_2000p2 [Vanderwaltozyma polyspora DSM 70294]EDO19038.1 hypothetical protein Kpol_2000p2 [Vanderwaltozyma polyspora DSM 70294]